MVIDRLAKDLGAEFPGVEGFSPRSLKYMRTFAGEWPDESIVQQVAAQLPWGHHMVLLDRIKNRTTREWYLQSAVEHGWSRNVLVHQISSRLHERQGKALSNFSRALPPEGSDLAEQILKDPYQFDFLTLASRLKQFDCVCRRGLQGWICLPPGPTYFLLISKMEATFFRPQCKRAAHALVELWGSIHLVLAGAHPALRGNPKPQ